MSGSAIRLKVASANNVVTVKPVPAPISRIVVKVNQNLLKVGAIVSGPRGVQGVPGTGGDLTYEQDFTIQSNVTVNHNLNKRPSVTVINSAGDVCEGSVYYLSANSLTVSFSAPFSGSVICN